MRPFRRTPAARLSSDAVAVLAYDAMPILYKPSFSRRRAGLMEGHQRASYLPASVRNAIAVIGAGHHATRDSADWSGMVSDWRVETLCEDRARSPFGDKRQPAIRHADREMRV